MAENLISTKEALSLPNPIFIDLRSEDEFSEAHIPGAINIPILKNEERSEVGKIYRNKSIEEAKILGLHYASYKLEEIYRKVLGLKRKYDNIIIYCWRGGMRSRAFCNLLYTLGTKGVYQLIGGYKAYRKFVLDFMDNGIKKYKFIVLHGLTGVGKTIIINKLEGAKISTVNLEKLAQNSGSVFGDILFKGNPPSQKQFESLLFHKLYNTNNRLVVVESEGKRIGSISIPDSMVRLMEEGHHILIRTSLKNRIKNIHHEYVKEDLHIDDKLIKCINYLNKKLGNKNVDMLANKIHSKDYDFAIKYLINNYYDPLYKYSINKLDKFDLSIDYDNIDDAVISVKDFIVSHFPREI